MPVPKHQLIAALLIFFLATALLVTPIVLWAVTTSKGTVKTSCSSDSDCNSHGLCVNGSCKCNSPWGGPFCDVLGNLSVAAQSTGNGVACSQVPTPCKHDADCNVCDKDVSYSCQTISSTQNDKGLSGAFCLPDKPASACNTGVSTADSIPGLYTWNGWADVEVQAWTCNCEFPNFYPLHTEVTSSGPTTACAKDPGVCQYGSWTYPCLRDPQNPLVCLNESCNISADCTDKNQVCNPITEYKKVCEMKLDTCSTVSDCPGCGTTEYPPYVYDPKVCPNSPSDCPGYTPDQISALCGTACVSGYCQKTCKVNSDCGSYPCINGTCATNPSTLVGSNPFEFGLCDCDNQTCSTDADCAGRCIGGVCMEQRVAMSPSGVPTCVKDSCAPGGTFVTLPIPPYTYGYCDCDSGYTAQGNTCVYTAGSSPPSTFCALGCGRGTCSAPGVCTCPSGWKGNSICTKFSCDMANGCGNGICTGPNTCTCDLGYSLDANKSCTVLTCPKGCVNGTCTLVNQVPTCVCNPGFTGDNCSNPVPVTCPSLQRGSLTDNTGACVVTTASSATATCTDGQPSGCKGAFFGNDTTFNNSGYCDGNNCTQGFLTPNVAGLPSTLCSDGTNAAPCSETTCKNKSIALNTCLQNDLYPYTCAELCSAQQTLSTYDYDVNCNKKTSVKPGFCS